MRQNRRRVIAISAVLAALTMAGCTNADFEVDTTSVEAKSETVTPRVTIGPTPTAAPAKLNPLEDEFSTTERPKAKPKAEEGAVSSGTTNSGVNVRVAPKGEAIDSIPDHVEVEILGREGNWFEVRYKDIQGYIYGQFLDIDGVNALDLDE